MKIKNTQNFNILIISALLIIGATVSYAQENTSSMKVFSEVPGANEIIAGDHSNAINQMLNAKSINKIALFNNLCVAYTLSYQFDLARNHCARAIKETYRSKNYGVTWLERTRSHRTKRLYRDRAREHFRIFESLEKHSNRIQF